MPKIKLLKLIVSDPTNEVILSSVGTVLLFCLVPLYYYVSGYDSIIVRFISAVFLWLGVLFVGMAFSGALSTRYCYFIVFMACGLMVIIARLNQLHGTPLCISYSLLL